MFLSQYDVNDDKRLENLYTKGFQLMFNYKSNKSMKKVVYRVNSSW